MAGSPRKRQRAAKKKHKLDAAAKNAAKTSKPGHSAGGAGGPPNVAVDLLDAWALTQGFEIPATKQKDMVRDLSEIVTNIRRSPRDRIRAFVGVTAAHFRQLELKQKQNEIEERLIRGYATDTPAVNVQVNNQVNNQISVDTHQARLLPVDDFGDPEVNEAYDRLARQLDRHPTGGGVGLPSAGVPGETGDEKPVEVCPASGSDPSGNPESGYESE